MTTDSLIRTLAARQHGMVTRAQLVRAGISDNRVAHRVRSGALERIHRGVFRIGPIASPFGLEMAAVLACGRRAVLSHCSAGVLWRLLSPQKGAPVDVITGSGNRGHQGIRIHRRVLQRTEMTRLQGMRVTTVTRTLLDLPALLPPGTLEHALAEALTRRLTSERQLRAALARHPGALGAPMLAEMLATNPRRTRSAAEERLLALLQEAQLPEPEVNVCLHQLEVDFLWREARLVVEVDGFRFHGGSAAFERDRERDARLLSAGFRVMRVTWHQLEQERMATMVRLGQALCR